MDGGGAGAVQTLPLHPPFSLSQMTLGMKNDFLEETRERGASGDGGHVWLAPWNDFCFPCRELSFTWSSPIVSFLSPSLPLKTRFLP